ncbi:DUF2637 domain-containing protein [Nocardiopsis sp. CC223A]|uniref:DUF2637 domain-containing protein n=1 Tax=Nocardiopsis sp. CC223A TaxID=3044051 RepID=UPI00278C25A8|nr:DUF2637 domain-containing protein [Nocardiopsis sp. CC223A]
MAPYNDSPGAGTRNGSPTGRGAGAGALAGGALFVGLIGLCALLISYNGVFRLAEYGHPRGGLLVHVFPVTYTLLLLMACWTSYLLRDAPPRRRAWVDLVLIPLLVLFAGAVMVLNNLGLIESIPQRVANVIVAVAPLVALLVALLLWMAARAHLRRKRRTGGPLPEPSDDRTTVLPARAVVYDEEPPTAEDDGRSLEERLMGLGLGPSATPPAEPEEAGRPDADGPEPVAAPEPAAARSEEAAPEPEDPEPEVSVPTLPLPRRGSGGGNPIKEAAENPPLVPIASEPEPESEPEPAPVRAPVSTGPADEGFEHDPLPGDPVTDEAEAPGTAPVPEPAVAGAPAQDGVPEAVEEEAPEEEPREETPEEEPADTPAFGVSWEPPEDDEDTWTRAEYVPPVWTPPEEDAPEEPEEVPAPALDHDTGPAVRAAFRIPDDPMADSRSVLSDDLSDDRPVWSPPAADPRPADTGHGVPAATAPSAADDDLWPVTPRIRVSATGPTTAEQAGDDDPHPPTAEPVDTAEATPAGEDEPLWPAPSRTARAGARSASDAPAAEDPHTPEDPDDRVPATSPAAPAPESGSGRTRQSGPGAPAVPPGAARPREDDTDDDAERTTEPLRRRPELEKRPMVLKPPRPPMPDFASGPPSRRVRSEPLRPDE